MSESKTIGLRTEEYVIMEKHRKVFSITAIGVGILVTIVCFIIWLTRLMDNTPSLMDTLILGLILILVGVALIVIGAKETGFTWKEAKDLNDNYKVVKK